MDPIKWHYNAIGGYYLIHLMKKERHLFMGYIVPLKVICLIRK